MNSGRVCHTIPATQLQKLTISNSSQKIVNKSILCNIIHKESLDTKSVIVKRSVFERSNAQHILIDPSVSYDNSTVTCTFYIHDSSCTTIYGTIKLVLDDDDDSTTHGVIRDIQISNKISVMVVDDNGKLQLSNNNDVNIRITEAYREKAIMFDVKDETYSLYWKSKTQCIVYNSDSTFSKIYEVQHRGQDIYKMLMKDAKDENNNTLDLGKEILLKVKQIVNKSSLVCYANDYRLRKVQGCFN